MATWNRNVTVDSDGKLVVSLASENANPPDHPNDTANVVNISADDVGADGAKIIYRPILPPDHGRGTSLTLDSISADPDGGTDCDGTLSELSVAQLGNGILRITVPSTAATNKTYCYLINSTYVDNGTTTHPHTPDPMIHNQVPGGPLPV